MNEAELRQRMAELSEWHRVTVANHRAAITRHQNDIANAHEHFDRNAVGIHRELAKLEAAKPKPPKRQPRQQKQSLTDQIQESLRLAEEALTGTTDTTEGN